jgi:hypothetical protein
MNDVQVCLDAENSTLLGCGFEFCQKAFKPTNKRQRFCSAKCRAAAKYLPLKMFNIETKNARFARLNRDRSLGFDGRYGGPQNLSMLERKVPHRLPCGRVKAVGVVANKFASAGV